ncbi:MAG: glycosyltransferase 87 family protein [Acidimicrobiales bacterium]
MTAAAVAFKAFPLAMLAVALWQRRWRLVAATGAWCALLALAALVLVPPSTFQEFVTAAGEISGKAIGNPYNGSIANALHDVVGSFDGTGAGGLALAALVVVGGAGVALDPTTRR